MGNGGWHLPSKTLCAECGKPIRRTKSGSYSCRAPDFQPRHWACVSWKPRDEMAATTGDTDDDA